ncbi:MAG: bifunctional diaminohydroxyphosphoribosylaminopyrimidine deaminase/5-amino-6-(5-phosphoribosylamino)uracil reductase RibD, partial [Myxococcales bacterium]|nr:bifunctional diaminohydroxyphosphoribosylaminopyrimidine deaminase/5-amino-6-(5-phosphoribosylamino)uracil reductase RibD [Myxococcales bacterium]
RWMRAALREACHGDPSPNPHVGAVLVKAGKLVAKGYHRRAGDAHAEVAALKRAGKRARGATLYVTFEPCNHFGRTPPCTDAIIAAGVERVVVGARDMAPHVPGAERKLRRAGIEVTYGVCEAEAEALVRDFAKHIRRGLPEVTLKSAATLDGHTASRTGESKWITGEAARGEAHRMRAYADAVLVGVGTVLADNPHLNVRLVKGRAPVRVVLDSELRTPVTANVVTGKGGHTIVFHASSAPPGKRRALGRAGAELVEVARTSGGLDLKRVLRELGKRDIVRLLVEGGAAVHGSLLRERLADRAALFYAPKLLGDPAAYPLANAGPAPHLRSAVALNDVTVRHLGEDLLVEGRLRYAGARAK